MDIVSKRGDQVKEEVALAKAKADLKHQALQKEELEASSKARQMLTRFIPRSEAEIEERKRLELQQELRYSRKCP